MATEVPMPKLGLTMQDGRIIEWSVPDGALVAADDEILLIETDKTETAVGSPGAGRLHQLGRPGETFECGQLIGWLLAEGELPPTAATPAGPAAPIAHARFVAPPVAVVASTGGRILASPNARRVAGELGVTLASVRGSGPGGRIVSEDVEAAALSREAAPVPTALSGELVVATAAARQLADLLGIDLAQVSPDPIERRVTRDAVALHVRRLLSASHPAATRSSTPLLQEPSRVVPLTGMRGTIARRMHDSLRDSAQLTLTMDADVGAVLADRAGRKASGATSVPSITDYVVAAVARALGQHPLMNSQVTDAGIALLPEVHVGLAVALDGGLVVPVIRDTASRSLDNLAAETSRLASAARAGTLAPADLDGGTFAVSALGSFGVDTFTPVINPPNAGVLGVGRVREDLALVDGAITTISRLTLSLTWDHRVLDGVPAAEFCRAVAELLSSPDRLG